jgi:Dolichyl-phosphate-mannose-protein mannosyltransferase
MPTAEAPRRLAWPLLGVVLAGGLGLRLWGIQQGLPYAYNIDEADHFVPRAVEMFAHGLNPHYFANPPGFTYLLHLLFAIAYGGKHGVLRTFALHPTSVYTLSRVTAAVLGVLALWLTYVAGARLIGRWAGLLAAAIEAVAFLPVYYSHVALNDVPTLAPLTLSLVGSAGVLRKGRARDCVLAAAGLGLACATKYTGGIALAPLAAAIAARYLAGAPNAGRRALRDLALAAAVALLFFLIANPYAVLDYSSFHSGLIHQSTLAAESQGKLGAPRHGGLAYYLWSLTWGLGWVPALAALGGALAVWRRDAALGWMLVPAVVLFLAFMGVQGRYFGRWLMPILPILCLLAALFALQLMGAIVAAARRSHWLARSGGRARAGAGAGASAAATAAPRSRGWAAACALLAAALCAALLAQSVVHSVHGGLVLSRADTRSLTRAWLVAHVPARASIVAEPVSPAEWAREVKPGTSTSQNAYRWNKYRSLEPRIDSSGGLIPGTGRLVSIEDYERTLSPALIGYYESHGYCWVVSGSTQSGRAFADPGAVPHAVAYYRALAAQGEVVYRSSPYRRDARPVPFGFDWSFNYYPLAYYRPGPYMTVYRLRAGRCAH